MGATLTTMAASLQKHYLPGVNFQLNNGVFLFKEIRKQKVKWTGENCVVHAHISRNTGTGFSGGTLPTAGNQGTIQLEVSAARFYGRFSVDGLAMASAPNEAANVFISWANLEMKGLVNDCKVALNAKTISGGLVKGYLNEHKASTTTNADQVVGSATSTTSTGQIWQYSGHFDEFNGEATGVPVVAATPATWVPVSLIRCDTYNPVDYVTNGGAPTNLNIFVSDYDEDAMTLTLRVGTDDAGTDTEVHGFTTATVGTGFAIALLIRTETATDSAAANFGRVYSASAINSLAYQANGIFSCLSLPSYYGHTRHVIDAAALPAVATNGTAYQLRCQVRTMSESGDHARTAITGARMERMKNIIEVESDMEPDSFMVHTYFKSTYQGLTTLVQNVDATKTTGLNVGFKKNGYAHGETPMRTDRHVPRGLAIFFNKKSWVWVQKGTAGFADKDGSVFSRVSGQDEYEGFWYIYYNLVCKRPNSNMILTGFSI